MFYLNSHAFMFWGCLQLKITTTQKYIIFVIYTNQKKIGIKVSKHQITEQENEWAAYQYCTGRACWKKICKSSFTYGPVAVSIIVKSTRLGLSQRKPSWEGYHQVHSIGWSWPQTRCSCNFWQDRKNHVEICEIDWSSPCSTLKVTADTLNHFHCINNFVN